MKKFLLFIVFLILFLALPKTANATTTLYLGGNIGAGETIADGTVPALYSGGLSNFVFNITHIKKIEIVLEYQKGATNYYWPLSTEYSNIRIGYPIVNEKAGLIFITAGYQNFKREQLTEARGFMIGMDLIVAAAENFYAGVDLQFSPFAASYRRTYPYYLDLPMEQLTLKIKLQYAVTDRIGLMANLQWLYFDANHGLIVENIITPSVGLIFRF